MVFRSAAQPSHLESVDQTLATCPSTIAWERVHFLLDKKYQLNIMSLLLSGKGNWVWRQAASSLCHKWKATAGVKAGSDPVLYKRGIPAPGGKRFTEGKSGSREVSEKPTAVIQRLDNEPGLG